MRPRCQCRSVNKWKGGRAARRTPSSFPLSADMQVGGALPLNLAAVFIRCKDYKRDWFSEANLG